MEKVIFTYCVNNILLYPMWLECLINTVTHLLIAHLLIIVGIRGYSCADVCACKVVKQ